MNNSLIKIIGFLSIIIGLGLNVISFSKFTSNNSVVELSNITILNAQTQKCNWSAMIGLLLICTGVIVLWQSYTKTKII